MIKINEKSILSLPPLIYMVVFFLLPTMIMVFIAFREPGDFGGVRPILSHVAHHTIINLSLESFKLGLFNKFIWNLFLRSLIFSVITTICCLILGYPVALLIARMHNIKNLLLLLVVVPFWSSFLIRVYAWMIILGPESGVNHMINYIVQLFGFDPLNLLYSSFAVVICLIYINLPFMILPLYANLEKHDSDLIDASRDLGASRMQAFLKITIPLSMPGVLAGSLLVFIPSMGMFVIPELVGNNCSLMIGNLIKQQFLQTMNWPLGSVTSIIMTVVAVSIAVTIGYLLTSIKGLQHTN